MYSKRKINILYKIYADTRDEEVLGRLILECEPIIDIVLTRYKKYSHHAEDTKQEVKLKMWKNLRLRTRDNLERYFINPTSYLFFLIRLYVSRAFWKLHKIYGEDIEILLDNKEIADFPDLSEEPEKD